MKKRILVISPHPDDETIALGGSIAKFIDEGSEVQILTISGHLPPLYKREDYEKTVIEANQAFDILGISNSDFLEIPATMIGDQPLHEVNSKISMIVNDFGPHIVFFIPNCMS